MHAQDPLRLAVIVGSTRPRRIGVTVAHWFVGQASTRPDLTLDVIDPAVVGCPWCCPCTAIDRRSRG